MAKSHLAGTVLIFLLSGTGWAAPPSPSLIATPPQPKWSELTVQQKIILAPLADDWDSFEYFRQKQWIGITARFSNMSSAEQSRIQKQMQEWGKLTPAQRQKARENFLSTAQLPSEKKRELKQKWEEYSNLPPEEKEKFKQQAEKNKPGTATGTALSTKPNPSKQVIPEAALPSLTPPADSGLTPSARPNPPAPPATETAPATTPANQETATKP